LNFDLSEEQRLLQSTARDWFAARYQPADMRRLLDTQAGGRNGGALADHTDALAEMGFLGMLVDPAHGGGGLSVLDLAVVAEEAGRVLAGVPLASTAAEAATLLGQLGGPDADGVLRDLAAGKVTLAVVHGPALDGVERLTGTAEPAPDARRATAYLVVLDGGDRLVLVRRGQGAGPVEQAATDPSRGIARVRFEAAPATVVASGPALQAALARARAVGATILSAEDLGAATRCLELAVEYARQRVAFGRPIGSFQAIKHMCVDMFVAVEQLRPLVWFAAWAADADPGQLPLAAAAARAYAADALERCAADCIQVHGGIGFTWEHDAHLFWRRAKVDRLLYGDAAANRDVVAGLGLAGVAGATAAQPASS